MKKLALILSLICVLSILGYTDGTNKSVDIEYPFIKIKFAFKFSEDALQALKKGDIAVNDFETFVLSEFYQVFKDNFIERASIESIHHYVLKAKLQVTFPEEFSGSLRRSDPTYYPQFIISNLEIYSARYSLSLPHKFYGNINEYNTVPTRDLQEAVTYLMKKIGEKMKEKGVFSFYEDENFWIPELWRTGQIVTDESIENKKILEKLEAQLTLISKHNEKIEKELHTIKTIRQTNITPVMKVVSFKERVIEKYIDNVKNFHSVALKLDKSYKNLLRLKNTIPQDARITFVGDGKLATSVIPGRVLVTNQKDFLHIKEDRTKINPVMEISAISAKMNGEKIEVVIDKNDYLKMQDLGQNGPKVEEAKTCTSLFESMKWTDVLPRVYIVFED